MCIRDRVEPAHAIAPSRSVRRALAPTHYSTGLDMTALPTGPAVVVPVPIVVVPVPTVIALTPVVVALPTIVIVVVPVVIVVVALVSDLAPIVSDRHQHLSLI